MIPGAEIRFVAHQTGPIKTDRNILVVGATHSFVDTPKPDLVLVPGSEAHTKSAMSDEKLLVWLQDVHQQSNLTCSVCSGALILAAAGILNGHPATTHWAAMSALEKFGAIPQPSKRVVKSGKIYTAAGVSAGLDLAFTLLAELAGQERAEIAQLMIEYDPQPPFNAGHISKATEKVREKAINEMKYLSTHPTF
jgi:transcriptional regulator GlxA family with amidase domain